MIPRTWREQQGLSLNEVAKCLSEAMGEEVNLNTVWRIEQRGQIPSRALGLAYFKLSGGAVTPNDFYDLPAGGGERQDAQGQGAAA